MPEPDNLVLQLLRQIRAEMATKAELAELRAEMATKAELAELRAEMATKSELANLRTDLSGQIVGLRRAVVDYHTAVIGHGLIISDLEARLRRVEQHLDLPPMAAH